VNISKNKKVNKCRNKKEKEGEEEEKRRRRRKIQTHKIKYKI